MTNLLTKDWEKRTQRDDDERIVLALPAVKVSMDRELDGEQEEGTDGHGRFFMHSN